MSIQMKNGCLVYYGNLIGYDDTHFTVIIEVNPSGTFYGWVFKFMGKIRILSPQSCVDKMQDIARTFI